MHDGAMEEGLSWGREFGWVNLSGRREEVLDFAVIDSSRDVLLWIGV